MTIMARYSGTCGECGGRWQPGDPIQAGGYDLSGRNVVTWQHAACPPDSDDLSLRPGEQVCTACWLVHPQGACDR